MINENIKDCIRRCIEDFNLNIGRVYFSKTNGAVNSLKLLAYNCKEDSEFLDKLANYITKKIYDETSEIWIISLSTIDTPNPKGYVCLL